jgi:hypothetical protein
MNTSKLFESYLNNLSDYSEYSINQKILLIFIFSKVLKDNNLLPKKFYLEIDFPDYPTLLITYDGIGAISND